MQTEAKLGFPSLQATLTQVRGACGIVSRSRVIACCEVIPRIACCERELCLWLDSVETASGFSFTHPPDLGGRDLGPKREASLTAGRQWGAVRIHASRSTRVHGRVHPNTCRQVSGHGSGTRALTVPPLFTWGVLHALSIGR